MKSNSLISLTKKLLLSSLMLSPAFTYADNYNAYDIEIVLDSSGSMAEAVGGK